MTRIAGDSDAVFSEAIGRVVLSEDPCDANFAGHYMYMFHDADGAAWFKHRDTRAYVRLAAGSELAPCTGAAADNGSPACEAVQP